MTEELLLIGKCLWRYRVLGIVFNEKNHGPQWREYVKLEELDVKDQNQEW